jgi:translation initiation factor 2 subunit 1
MYECELPPVGDFVIATITSVTDYEAYVRLPEYGNIQGMVLLSAMTRKRVRSTIKLARIGQSNVMEVIRVDPKGYIDLSRNNVSPIDVKHCEDKFAKSRQVHLIMKHVAKECKIPLLAAYKTVGWPMYKKVINGHALDGFVIGMHQPDVAFANLGLTPNVLHAIAEISHHLLAPKPAKIQAEIELRCDTATADVDCLKTALLAGRAQSVNDVKLSVKVVAPPLYVISATVLNKELGLDIMQRACDTIQNVALPLGVLFELKTPPKVVSKAEQLKFDELLTQLERNTIQVPADDDDDND